MDKKFKTAMLGYDKAQVDEYVKKREADIEALVEDSKEKIKQAQRIAVKANEELDALKKEMDMIKAELDQLKKQGQ